MIQKYLFLKLCFGRALSHFSLFSGLLDKILLIAVFLKLFGVQNYFLVGVVGVIASVILLLVGYFDLRCGVAEAEVSLSNKFNPEIQRLLRGLK